MPDIALPARPQGVTMPDTKAKDPSNTGFRVPADHDQMPELSTTVSTPDGSTVESKAKGFSVVNMADEIKGWLGQWAKAGIVGGLFILSFYLVTRTMDQNKSSQADILQQYRDSHND